MRMANLTQRTGTDRCARCRKALSPGERVTVAYIVQKVGRNPESKTLDLGAFLGEDFELAHVSCADPGLEGTLIT